MHALVEVHDRLSMESIAAPLDASGQATPIAGTRFHPDITSGPRMSTVFPRNASALPGVIPGMEGAAPKGLLARRRMTIIMAQQTSPNAGSGIQHDLISRSFKAQQAPGQDAILSVPDPEAHTLDTPRQQQGARKSSGAASQMTQPSFGANKSFNGGKSVNARSGKMVMAQSAPPEAPVQGVLKQMPNWKQSVLKVLNHKWYYVFLFITTFYIIFENDLKRAALPPSCDTPLEAIITVIMVCLIIEMGLSCFVRPGYLLGFYFWVDCIVCASLFFEVPSVKSQVLGMGVYPTSLEQRDSFFAWVGNRAFVSSQVARVARIFRLLRLLRLYSVYRRFEARRRIRAALAKAGIRPGHGEEQIAEEELSIIELEMLQDQNRETRVGQKLEELIIRRIIVFVLVCMLILPVFEPEYGLWGKYQSVGQGGLSMLHQMAVSYGSPVPINQSSVDLTAIPPSAFTVALKSYLQGSEFRMGSQETSKVLELIITNTTYLAYPSGTTRRYDELYFQEYYSQNLTAVECTIAVQGINIGLGQSLCPMLHTYALYDWKWYSQISAVLSISRSLFIIFFLMLGAWLLNRDSRVLVLEPIERMLARVAALAENPLALQPAAHAPWQEQLERMQQAQEQAAAQQAETEMSNGLTGRIKSMPDLFFGTTQQKHAPSLVHPGGSGQAHAHAVISLLPTSSQQGSTSDTPLPGQPITTLAWAETNTDISVNGVVVNARTGSTGNAAGGWRIAGSSVTAALRLQNDAGNTRWQRLKDKTNRILRRLATNFWDGTDEEHPVAHRPAGPGPNPRSGDAKHGDGKVAQQEVDKNTASYETQVLENSIQKIGALLAVGFGDAGAEIIAENIKNEGDINPMVPGRKTVAVFGFCDIRRFTDATEVLQEEVMEFVNSIARIVHTSVAIHGGAANKNIGDAFLLVWKLPKAFTMSDLTDACDYIGMSPPSADSPTVPTTSPDTTHGVITGQLPQPQRWVSSPGLAIAEGVEEELRDEDAVQDLRTLATLGPGPSPWAAMSTYAADDYQLPAPEEPFLALTAWTPQAGAETVLVPLPSSIDPVEDIDNSPRQMKFSSQPPEVFSYTPHDSSYAVQDVPLPLPGIVFDATIDAHPEECGSLTSHKSSWLLSVGGDNRVAPLPTLEPVSSNSLATKGKRMFSRGATGNMTRTGKAGSLGAPVHIGDARIELGKDGDLESEAVQRVMRMRSKGGAAPASISVPEKAAVVSAVADNALMSFIIIHAALKRSVRLARYSHRSDLDARLGPNFRVQMGFGLHVGWAIEGAIGSEYKIDASYLSPNVNMASRLEAATKQFGVSILMSESFAACLSAEMRARVRQIDCVTVKGSVQPMGLFTYDINLDNIEEPDPDVPGAEEEEEAFWANYACGLCESDDVANTWGVTPEFLEVFKQGFQAYKSGNWKSAHSLLTIASGMRRTSSGLPLPDKPAHVLMSFMEEHGLQSPTTWKGFRELTEK